MSYCVNCRQEYSETSGICPKCYSDQVVPNEIIDLDLRRRKNEVPNPHDIKFGFPGEKTALIVSITASIGITVILGTISLGILFGVLVINLIYLYINYKSSQKNLIRVSEDNFKAIFRLSKIASHRLKLSLPEIYIMHDPKYNAYTSGLYKYGYIVIHSSMVNEFKPAELLFVIGHEMGHIKRYHTTWLTLQNPAKAAGARFIFAPIIKIVFNVWSVKAEHTADQAGLIACKNLNSAVISLLKFAGGPDIEKEVDIRKIIRHEEENENLDNIIEYFGAHPFIKNRIKQLINFSSTLSKNCTICK